MRIEMIVERGFLKVELPYELGQQGEKRIALLDPSSRFQGYEREFRPSIQFIDFSGPSGPPREHVTGTNHFYKPRPGNSFYEEGKDFWRPTNSYSRSENLGPETIEYQAFEALVKAAEDIQKLFDSKLEYSKKYNQPSSTSKRYGNGLLIRISK